MRVNKNYNNNNNNNYNRNSLIMSSASWASGMDPDGSWSIELELDKNAKETFKRFLAGYYEQLAIQEQVDVTNDLKILGKMRGSSCPVERLVLTAGDCEDVRVGSQVVNHPWPLQGMSGLELGLVTDGFRVKFQEFHLKSFEDNDKKQAFKCEVKIGDSFLDLLGIFDGSGWEDNLIKDWEIFPELELGKKVVSGINSFFKNRSFSFDFSVADLCLIKLSNHGVAIYDPEKTYLTIAENSWFWISRRDAKKKFRDTLIAARTVAQQPVPLGGDVTNSINSFSFHRGGKMYLESGPGTVSAGSGRGGRQFPRPVSDPGYRSVRARSVSSQSPNLSPIVRPGNPHSSGTTTPVPRLQSGPTGGPRSRLGGEGQVGGGRGLLLQQLRQARVSAGEGQVGKNKSTVERFLEARRIREMPALSKTVGDLGTAGTIGTVRTPMDKLKGLIQQSRVRQVRDERVVEDPQLLVKQDQAAGELSGGVASPASWGGAEEGPGPSFSRLALEQPGFQPGEVFNFGPAHSTPTQQGGWRERAGDVSDDQDDLTEKFQSAIQSPSPADDLLERVKRASKDEQEAWGNEAFAGTKELGQEEVLELLGAFNIHAGLAFWKGYFIVLDALSQVHQDAEAKGTILERFFSHVVLVFARLVINEFTEANWDEKIPELKQYVQGSDNLLNNILAKQTAEEKRKQQEEAAAEAARMARDESVFELPPGVKAGWHANVEDLLSSLSIRDGQGDDEGVGEVRDKGPDSQRSQGNDSSGRRSPAGSPSSAAGGLAGGPAGDGTVAGESTKAAEAGSKEAELSSSAPELTGSSHVSTEAAGSFQSEVDRQVTERLNQSVESLRRGLRSQTQFQQLPPGTVKVSSQDTALGKLADLPRAPPKK